MQAVGTSACVSVLQKSMSGAPGCLVAVAGTQRQGGDRGGGGCL